ncbi:MAG: membrane protein insertase YidC [Bacteroidia bacterium]|nr:membrane protein insertase YidC [Bacteroidia bacterium]
MDRNNIIGLVLIFVLFMVWAKINAPTDEELARQQAVQDSLALVETQNSEIDIPQEEMIIAEEPIEDIPVTIADSVTSEQDIMRFGAFSRSARGKESVVNLENEKLKIEFNTKGGNIKRVTLKDYTVSVDPRDSVSQIRPVTLLDNERNKFEYILPVANLSAGYVSTSDLVFQPELNGNTLSLKAETDGGGYIEQVYSLTDEYALDYDMRLYGMDNILDRSKSSIQLNWINYLNKLELNDDYERYYSSVYFKESEESPDYCNCRGDDEEDADNNPIEWISHSNQFFNVALMAERPFQSGLMTTRMLPEDATALKELKSEMMIPFDQTSDQVYNMKMYLGPNEFKALRDYEINLEEIIPFGASFFGTINRWLVRPFFNFLQGFIGNMGLAIVIMTLIIKVALSPLMYKMLYSQSKMAALKPRIDEMKKKFDGDQQKQQMETMKLYREYGANPLGGCMPMVLQMPIWIALYRFFPASIDFRQQSFLWAHDLSSYDVLFYLPMEIPFLGAHISLFTILWATTTLIYTYYNTRHMDMTANPAMKYMQYAMPVMFFGFFNTYASGLTCYLFFSNATNIAQTIITKNFIIDKDKIARELEAYKNDPKKKKKGGFQQRLEAAMAEQQKIRSKQETKKKKKK